MRTFILFLFGDFDDVKDIEFFCLEVLNNSEYISEVKYVIQNLKNIIIIFDSNVEDGILRREVHDLLNNETILFYFMFEQSNLLLAHIPENINDIIFKPSSPLIEDSKEYKVNSILSLDVLLEKIQAYGLSSLTKEERRFLDDYY